jgi:hypothetical protein
MGRDRASGGKLARYSCGGGPAYSGGHVFKRKVRGPSFLPPTCRRCAAEFIGEFQEAGRISYPLAIANTMILRSNYLPCCVMLRP